MNKLTFDDFWEEGKLLEPVYFTAFAHLDSSLKRFKELEPDRDIDFFLYRGEKFILWANYGINPREGTFKILKKIGYVDKDIPELGESPPELKEAVKQRSY